MKKNGYTLGLVSVSFRQHSPEEILENMRRVGLSCVEWGSDIHAPCTDIEGLKNIAQTQKEYGISCCSYGTYFRLGETPLEELGDHIRAARVLGTDILRLWCGAKSGALMSAEERDGLLEVCRRAARIAESYGVTLCMECHKKTFTELCDDAVRLMRAVDSPSFRMYWQPFQWRSVEENMVGADKLAPYAEHIHVFNWKGSEKLSLALAVDEWRGYLRSFSTPRTLLLEFMPGGQIEELADEVEALKRIIGAEK